MVIGFARSPASTETWIEPFLVLGRYEGFHLGQAFGLFLAKVGFGAWGLRFKI